MSFPGFRWVLLVTVCCLSPLLAGCGDEAERVPAKQPFLVVVLDQADGSPVSGIKIVVMDPESNLPVAGPLVSGVDGLCNFGNFSAGQRRLMVFPGVGYRLHALPDFWPWTEWNAVSPGPGIRWGSPTAPDSRKADPAPVHMLTVLVHKVQPDSLPRIAGLIVDAVSGAPVRRAFVGLSPYLAGYQGQTYSSDDVTGGDGNFSVSRIPFAMDHETGNLVQVEPLRFTCPGYRPLMWRFEPPNGSDNVDISGITIALEPVDENDRAEISGRLWREGHPVAGITVGLGFYHQSGGQKSSAGMPGWVAVSDQEGSFTIGALPGGTYLLQPGYPLADGAFFPGQGGHVPLRVEAGQALDAGDFIMLHEIEPQTPPHGLALMTPPTSLHWTAVPGAQSYEVRFDRGVLPPTDTNSITIPETLTIDPGLHYWSVLAFDSENRLLGATQIQAVFRLHSMN